VETGYYRRGDLEDDGRFLVVEERINHASFSINPQVTSKRRDIIAALVREVREETAWVFLPEAFLASILVQSDLGARDAAVCLQRRSGRS